jgi:hypothetical protein
MIFVTRGGTEAFVAAGVKGGEDQHGGEHAVQQITLSRQNHAPPTFRPSNPLCPRTAAL